MLGSLCQSCSRSSSAEGRSQATDAAQQGRIEASVLDKEYQGQGHPSYPERGSEDDCATQAGLHPQPISSYNPKPVASSFVSKSVSFWPANLKSYATLSSFYHQASGWGTDDPECLESLFLFQAIPANEILSDGNPSRIKSTTTTTSIHPPEGSCCRFADSL